MKNKFFSISLTFLCLSLFVVLVSSAVSASDVQVTSSLEEAYVAYITNSSSNTVYAIDTATNTILASVTVGTNPYGVAVSPDGTKAYVTNHNSSNVSVIDTATNKVTATIDVGINPHGVAINPTGSKAYVANWGSDTVSVIDTDTDTVISTVNVGTRPSGVAVNPVGTQVYVTNYGSGTVSVINTATDNIMATIPIGSCPVEVTVNPQGTKAYVVNSNYYGTVSVIDTATNIITATVDVKTNPFGVAVNPDGTKVYVTNELSSSVSVIDTATNTVTDSMYLESYLKGIAVNPKGTKLYVTSQTSNSIYIIDTATNSITATLGLGGNYYIAFGQLINPDSAPEALPSVSNLSSNETKAVEQTKSTITSSEENKEDSLSASVSLHGEKTHVVYGDDILLKLSAVNLITKPTMHVQVIIIPPSGMVISSSEFVQSGAGQYTTTYELEPGQGKDIEVRIAANQVGNYDVKGRVVYYFGDEIESAEDYTLNLPIQVEPKIDPEPTSNSTSYPIPGFKVTNLVFILMVLFILKIRIIQ